MTDKELLKWIEENKPASDGGYIVPVEWMREWFKSAPFMKKMKPT